MERAARLVVLVRHGKAESGEEGSDRERRLTSRGEQDATAAGRWLAGRLPAGASVWVSSAVRARQTWEGMAPELPEPGEVRVYDLLYHADAPQVVELLTELAAPAAVVVGHNPTMEGTLRLLADEWRGMRTGAVAVVEVDGRRGRLVELWEPSH